MAPLISVRNLRYRYGDGTEALAGVDFDLYPGETVVLLGANGSGKTTFALHLNGLLRGEGSVEVSGRRVEPKSFPEVRRKVGMVFQDSQEQLFMPTVLEDVTFGPLNQGISPEIAVKLARDMLAHVGMSEAAARAPYHLSAGEKRRVAIAGVLVMEPEILVLDEPTTYLDPPGWRELVALLRRLPQAKLLITHDLAFAQALATRAVFFEKGRITDEGTVDEVSQRQRWTTGD